MEADAHNETVLRHYEGLIYKTAQRYAPFVEEEFEDIQQMFRLKVFLALRSYDPEKSNLSRDAYVFSCLKNRAKDLLKKRRRGDVFIEDLAPAVDNARSGGSLGNGTLTRDAFESRYFSTSHDEIFGGVEDDVLLPSTLTGQERKVVALLYRDYQHAEIAGVLEITKREVELAVKEIRLKMADWRPARPAEDMSVGEPAAASLAA